MRLDPDRRGLYRLCKSPWSVNFMEKTVKKTWRKHPSKVFNLLSDMVIKFNYSTVWCMRPHRFGRFCKKMSLTTGLGCGSVALISTDLESVSCDHLCPLHYNVTNQIDRRSDGRQNDTFLWWRLLLSCPISMNQPEGGSYLESELFIDLLPSE